MLTTNRMRTFPGRRAIEGLVLFSGYGQGAGQGTGAHARAVNSPGGGGAVVGPGCWAGARAFGIFHVKEMAVICY